MPQKRVIDLTMASSLGADDVFHIVHGTEDLQETMDALSKFIHNSSQYGRVPIRISGDYTVAVDSPRSLHILSQNTAASKIYLPDISARLDVMDQDITVYNAGTTEVVIRDGATDRWHVAPGSAKTVRPIISSGSGAIWITDQALVIQAVPYTAMGRDENGCGQVTDPMVSGHIATKNSSDRAIQTEIGKVSEVGIIIPMYIYPANVYTHAGYNGVIALAKQFHDVPIHVILNPASGPGTQEDGNYVVAIKRLHGAGIKVYGYTHCSYGARNVDDVILDMIRWQFFYPEIDGIFLDEMSVNLGDIPYTKAIKDYANVLGFLTTIGNPGTMSINHGAYMDAKAIDIIIYYESNVVPSESDLKGDMENGYASYSYRNRGVLLYQQPSFNYELFRMIERYAGLIYITEVVSGSQWNYVSGYLEEMLRLLSTRGGSSVPYPNSPMVRDENRRVRISDGVGIDDAVTKGQMDLDLATKAPMPQSGAGVGQWVRLVSLGDSSVYLPSGGSWAFCTLQMTTYGLDTLPYAGISSGGSHVTNVGSAYEYAGFAWRIS